MGNYTVRKNILVTTDFSSPTQSAIKLAIKLCREMDCDLILLHTYRLTNKKSEDVVAWKQKIELDARDEFSFIEDELLRDSGIRYALKIEVGFMADRVEETIRRNEIVFLIADKLMYSRSKATFDELVESTDVPIIIAPYSKTSVTDPSTSSFH